MFHQRFVVLARLESLKTLSLSSSRTGCKISVHSPKPVMTRSVSTVAHHASFQSPQLNFRKSLALGQTRGAQTKPSFSWDVKKDNIVMNDASLKKRLGRIQYLVSEARLCINDCRESIGTEHYEEEIANAKSAIETASVSCSDVFEELAATDNGVQILNEIRRTNSPVIEGLRHELNVVIENEIEGVAK